MKRFLMAVLATGMLVVSTGMNTAEAGNGRYFRGAWYGSQPYGYGFYQAPVYGAYYGGFSPYFGYPYNVVYDTPYYGGYTLYPYGAYYAPPSQLQFGIGGYYTAY